MVVRQIPELRYAVFAHKGPLTTLHSTYHQIYQVWLPKSGYQVANHMDMEVYDNDFKFGAEDSVMYILVAITK
jgi:AraC family transcriptional regulator